MACSCHSQYNNICVPQYGGACPVHLCNVRSGGVVSPNRPTTRWTNDPITKTTFISMVHINELRTALNAELSVRKLSAVSWQNPGSFFSSQQWTQIKSAIDSCRQRDGDPSFAYRDSYNPGDVITASGMTYLRNFVNILQQVCMCQCNYDCACNCDYCTCNCNNCSCNCAWWCPCQCNYSDERLKENIEYL